MKELIGDYESFVANINWGLYELGIEATDLAMMDHLCYRVETNRRYYELKRQIGRIAALQGEIEVSERMIAVFDFYEPLEVGGWRIPSLELPQPKQRRHHPEGLEHAEFVPYGSLDWFQRTYEHLPFTYNGMNKAIDPELGLKHAGISVKFHEKPIGAVARTQYRLEAEGK